MCWSHKKKHFKVTHWVMSKQEQPFKHWGEHNNEPTELWSCFNWKHYHRKQEGKCFALNGKLLLELTFPHSSSNSLSCRHCSSLWSLVSASRASFPMDSWMCLCSCLMLSMASLQQTGELQLGCGISHHGTVNNFKAVNKSATDTRSIKMEMRTHIIEL